MFIDDHIYFNNKNEYYLHFVITINNYYKKILLIITIKKNTINASFLINRFDSYLNNCYCYTHPLDRHILFRDMK